MVENVKKVCKNGVSLDDVEFDDCECDGCEYKDGNLCNFCESEIPHN